MEVELTRREIRVFSWEHIDSQHPILKDKDTTLNTQLRQIGDSQPKQSLKAQSQMQAKWKLRPAQTENLGVKLGRLVKSYTRKSKNRSVESLRINL